MGSLLYEALLLTALILAVGFALLPLLSPGLASPAGELSIPTRPMRVALLCALLAGAGGYFVWSWTGGRRTLPMKTWRIRIVTNAGRNLTLRTALVRYVVAWIGPALALSAYAGMGPLGSGTYAQWLVLFNLLFNLLFNYLWAIVDRDRQFLHDRIAGTVLLRTAE